MPDKFAAMAASRASAANTVEPSASSSASGDGSRDRTQQTEKNDSSQVVNAAASTNQDNFSTSNSSIPQPPLSVDAPAPAPPPATASRGAGKIAAMVARNNSPVPPTVSSNNKQPANRGAGKLAAMAAKASASIPASSSSTAVDTTSKEAAAAKSKAQAEAAAAAKRREEYKNAMKARLQQRHDLLRRLDRAEDLTLDLLMIAGKTADGLQDLNITTASSTLESSNSRRSIDIAKLSEKFRSTLKELHPLLTDNGSEKLVRPYYPNGPSRYSQQIQQQQQQVGEQSSDDFQAGTDEQAKSIYEARVEMRLVQDKAEVLRAFVQLEKEENEQGGMGIDGAGNGYTSTGREANGQHRPLSGEKRPRTSTD